MNSEKVSTLLHKHGGWRATRYLVIGLALGGWLAGTAFAQQEQANASDTAKPVTAMKAASKTSSPSSSASSSSSSPVAKSSVSSSSSSTVTPVTKANESYSSSSSSEQPLPPPAVLPAGINVGNYNIHSSLEMGWRYNNITGSQANYDTFVNLHQGPRLLNFSFNARSLNHHGSLFDTLSMNGFGFGGDPVDVVRLNMTKDRWYDFNATYRRYKYFWGYNLLANPLNTAATGQPITTAPHLLDLSHRMTDLQLRLLPQSSFHIRLGYAHSLEVGPSYTTTGAGVDPFEEPGATALLFQSFKTTDDMYHAGFDYVGLPRTMLSYDQFIQHYKEDTQWNDASLNYQLPDGTPVGLGVVFSQPLGSDCNPTTTSSGTTPPTVGLTCQANLFYDRGGRPRGTTPTERFSFQTTYFRNLNMTGAISYSSGYQRVNDLYDTWTGLNTRLNGVGSDETAASKANQIIVNGNWSAVYQITSKLRAMESLSYNDYQIPGVFNFGVLNLYAQEAPGNAVLGLPPGQFTPTDCPSPFTAPTCPQHNSSDGPDLATGYRSRYMGQKWFSNTFELGYDFNPKVGARLGYRYVRRKIWDQDSLYYTSEVFYPGGPSGAAAAYRGDCALLKNGQLPTGCALQSDGSIIFTGLTPGSDTSHGLMADINGNAAVAGLWVRPTSNFRTSFNLELFSADEAFTRVTPRLIRHYTINSVYTPVRWVNITGAVDIAQGSDDVVEVYNQDHNRSYSLSTIFTPNSRFSLDLMYNYDDVYTQALDCFAYGFGDTPASTGFGSCPTYPNLSEVDLAAMSTYTSKTNFASADITVRPVKQLSFDLGYTGSFVRGTPSWYNPFTSYSVNFLDTLTPWGPLRFNYQTPFVKMDWKVYKGLEYVASWNYYGYNTRGDNNPVGLAPLGTQDFNGNNMMLSVKYAF